LALNQALETHVDSLQSIVQKRAKPLVILLDPDRRITYADKDALRLIGNIFDVAVNSLERLPYVLDAAVAEAIAADDESPEKVINPLPGLFCRINWLTGPNGWFTAVYLEQQRFREDLASIASRFSLTQRERQVLQLILCGLSGAEIAQNLQISDMTVCDYFKSLARKTQAKNRADMIARVLGWSGPREMRAPLPS
jgi:DNA-binding CsgD family transcriptional regulator